MFHNCDYEYVDKVKWQATFVVLYEAYQAVNFYALIAQVKAFAQWLLG